MAYLRLGSRISRENIEAWRGVSPGPSWLQLSAGRRVTGSVGTQEWLVPALGPLRGVHGGDSCL